LFVNGSGRVAIKLANGVNYHFKKAGSGKITIVFVHRYGFSSAIWDKPVALLAGSYSSYSLDIRGFGDSDKPGAGYTYGQVVNDRAHFLDALEIDRAILVGYSLGGIFLQYFAVTYPERILALILTNTFCRNHPPAGINPEVQ
jgi:pimeloyl-ACP methyl ester carboxylesterase